MYEGHVEALRRAAAILEDKETCFLCHALDRVGRRNPLLTRAVEEVKVFVDAQLEPSATLDSWIEANHPNCGHRIDDFDGIGPAGQVYRSKMLRTRLAWIDHMIDQYRSLDKRFGM